VVCLASPTCVGYATTEGLGVRHGVMDHVGERGGAAQREHNGLPCMADKEEMAKQLGVASHIERACRLDNNVRL
jgi:hypothetical protein